MSVRSKLGVLAIAAGVSITGQPGAWAQPPVPPTAASPQTPQPAPPQNTAPPNAASRQNGGSNGDTNRRFGSVPDDPGPLAKDLSPRLMPKRIAAAMHKVADWQLAQSQEYFAVFDRTRQLDGRIWTWGALYSGLMAASESLGDPKYANVMRDMGKTYKWELSTTESGANQHSLAQTYLELYLMDKQPEELAPTQAIFDGILARPRVELGANRRIEWWWCDALFMAPPAWARLYAATGDKKYLAYLDEEWAKTSKQLYDTQAASLLRDASFITKTRRTGRRSSGRAAKAGYGRPRAHLQYLPKDDPARAMYETQLKEMCRRRRQAPGPRRPLALRNA